MTATDQARREADLAEVAKLITALRAQVAGTQHRLGLTALMSLYMEVAMQHECCTAACATQAGKVSFLLAQHAAQHVSPAGPIH